jgi:acyl-CoA synthetase (AMP-forming)/AMP-acid ligase II
MSDTKNSGHRIGTAEVESALVSHPKCAEAAVVGIDHEVWFNLFFLFCSPFRQMLIFLFYPYPSLRKVIACYRLKVREYMPL